MDTTSRAPWLAVLRIALLGVGTLAALVLLSLLLGARPASAVESAPAAPTQQRGLVSGAVEGLGATVDHATGGVGQVVGGVVDPVRTAVAPHRVPTAPAPSTAPVAPRPAPATPAPAPAPAAPAPAASAPVPAAPAPASARPATPATAPAVPAATAPAAEPATHPVRHVVERVGSASRPVTDTVANVVRPVTGTVRTLADARPATTVVDTLDHVVGAVPVAGSVVGDDTLGTVTGPVTGLVDDALGDVGTAVGQVPDIVSGVVPSVGGVLPGGTDPVVDVPALPADGGSIPSAGPGTAAPAAGTGATATTPSTATSSAPPSTAPPSTTVRTTTTGTTSAERRSDAPADSPLATGPVGVAGDVQDATLGGTALLVPEPGNGPSVPFDVQRGPGALGGSASSTSGGAAAVGIVGSTDDIVSLAAGSRGTLSDDAVPASVVGEHDVAPD